VVCKCGNHALAKSNEVEIIEMAEDINKKIDETDNFPEIEVVEVPEIFDLEELEVVDIIPNLETTR
jgi:hypothetical protein